MKMSGLLLVLLFSLSFTVFGADDKQEAKLELWVKPKLCLRYKESKPCSLELRLRWTAPSEGNYCVYSAQTEMEPLQCWHLSSAGEYETEFTIDSDVEFWLSMRGSEIKLATAELELATLLGGGNKARNRRHIWNLI
ncbi:DUF3019 domain-containing protein [Agaribacterium sp. ZY112]|uniref:DUF3019 domain-containing protein n=1 Tax=Agaribacterium sp. ZY112 TaxID=3233574 RepID=UPI003523693F